MMLELFREIISITNDLIQQLPEPTEIQDKIKEFSEKVNELENLEREIASTSRFYFRRRKELKELLEKGIEKAKRMANELLNLNERALLTQSNIVRDFVSKHSKLCNRTLLMTVQKLPEHESLGDITVKTNNIKNIFSTLQKAVVQIKNDVLKWIENLSTEIAEIITLLKQISNKLEVPVDFRGDNFLKELEEAKTFLEKFWKLDTSTIDKLISKIERNYETLLNDLNTNLSTLITSFKNWILELKENTRTIEDVLLPPFPTIHTDLFGAVTKNVSVDLLRNFAKDVETAKLFEDDVKRRVLSKTLVLMRKNKSKMEVFKKYVEIEPSKLTFTLREPPTIDMPLNTLLAFLKELKEEEQYLNTIEKTAISELKSDLRSKLTDLLSKAEIIIEEGIKIPKDLTQRISVLLSQIENVKNVDSALSFESEYIRLLEGIKDAIKRSFLSERGRTIAAVSEFLGTVEAPVLRGQTIEELLQSFQELKKWKNQIKNMLKEKASKLIEELERGNSLLANTPWTNSELSRILAELRNEIRSTNKIEGILKLLDRINQLKNDEEERLKNTLEMAKREYMDVIRTMEELVVELPFSIRAPLHIDVRNKTYMELVKILPEIGEKVKQRDKLIKETLESFLLKIKNELERIPITYRENFAKIIQEIDSTIENLKETDNIHSAKEIFNQAMAEINRLLREKFSNLKSSLILKIRMAIIKMRNPPDVSDVVEKLNRVTIEQWEIARAVYEVDKIFREEILETLRNFVKHETERHIDLLIKLKRYGIDVEEFIIRLEEVSAKLSSQKELDVQEIGELGKIINDIITSQTLRQIFAKWLNLTVDALERTINYVSQWVEVESDFYEILPTLKKQSEILDSLEMDTIIKTIEHTYKLWEIARSYLEEIEKRRDMLFEEELKKIPYHNSIIRIWNKNKKEFDKIIFPLSELYKLREEIAKERTPRILELIREKEKLEKEWLEKEKQISIWHKSVRVFLTGISPMDEEEVKERKLKSIIEKIKKIYKRKDIQTYLILAVQTLLGE
nr:hypothetical protein [Candidatus Baldrarchaeota archaeon]